MAETTKIEWTESSWNPWQGCHKVSAGCKNCYMYRQKQRYRQNPNVVVRSADASFYAPLNWKEPRKIFTCSWSDFFIEEADAWRDEAFAIMALTPQHTYQILSKRADRMYHWFTNADRPPVGTLRQKYWRQWCVWAAMHNSADNRLACEAAYLWDWDNDACGIHGDWPLPNVWLGVSVEDQKTADERIPLLLQTPAALLWLSIEPLLGPVDLFKFFDVYHGKEGTNSFNSKIDWVVVGGESGFAARPMRADWVRSIRDQCKAAGVPFFFKQGSQANWPKFKDFDSFPLEFQIREMPGGENKCHATQ